MGTPAQISPPACAKASPVMSANSWRWLKTRPGRWAGPTPRCRHAALMLVFSPLW